MRCLVKIENSVVVITGASSGIGEATARLLSQRKGLLALAARSMNKLEALARELPGAFAVAVDMTDPASIQRMVAAVRKRFGRIDVLVNNAGRGGGQAPTQEIDLDVYRSLMEVNVYGPLVAMREVIPLMRAQRRGAIVNVGSGTTKLFRPNGGPYPATKAALHQLTLQAREELKADGVGVTIVHPFLTATAFFDRMPQPQRQALLAQADPPEKVAEAIARAIEENPAEISLVRGL
jgi:NADP-dependent 3-hydroxy acid dehydrogenase YdfG